MDLHYNEFLDEKIIKALINSSLSMFFARSIGELSFYMLKENFIDIYSVDEELTVRDIIQAYRENQLSRLTSPTHLLEESGTVTHETEGIKRGGP